MNIVRCGERPTFAWASLISAGVVCAALTGCGANSSGSLLGGSGGDPLGAAEGEGSGSSSGGGGAVAPTPPMDGGAAAASDAAAPWDPKPGATRGGFADASADAPPPEDTGSPLTTFSLLNTNVTTIIDGEPVVGYDPIAENVVLDLSKLGTALSIRANTTPATVGSVEFVLDGTYTHTENASPYTMCGDNGTGTITPCPLTAGKHMLVVTPYSGANLADAASPSTTLYFTVTGVGDGGISDGGAG